MATNYVLPYRLSTDMEDHSRACKIRHMYSPWIGAIRPSKTSVCFLWQSNCMLVYMRTMIWKPLTCMKSCNSNKSNVFHIQRLMLCWTVCSLQCMSIWVARTCSSRQLIHEVTAIWSDFFEPEPIRAMTKNSFKLELNVTFELRIQG